MSSSVSLSAYVCGQRSAWEGTSLSLSSALLWAALTYLIGVLYAATIVVNALFPANATLRRWFGLKHEFAHSPPDRLEQWVESAPRTLADEVYTSVGSRCL
jgi:hypothetical protein